MHPSKRQAVDSHNAKLRAMTRNYGSAGGPSMNKLAPMDRLKEEGPEQPVGFGVEYDAATARGDRPARRSVAANPLATYKRGGRVKKRDEGGASAAKGGSPTSSKTATDSNTRTSTKTSTVANPKGNVTVTGGAGDGDTSVTVGRSAKEQKPVRERAFGGRLDGRLDSGQPAPKKGAATNVNVIIAPQGGAQPGAGMVPPPMPGPPIPPSAAPAPPPGLPPGMGAAMPPGGAPPGMMPRAKGGRVTGYDAGAGSAEGRLEKIDNYGRKTANAKPQVV